MGGDAIMMDEGRSKHFSFKGAVINTGTEAFDLEDEWETEDLELAQGDVEKLVIDGVPSIDFLDRFYGLIDESMSRTLVVKLLGKKIGYNALWNKVCSLWKLLNRFQLMDFENDYYLAKFEFDLDYSNVLSKGPCVIYVII